MRRHVFRVLKGEIGLTHFEGRSHVSLKRHLALCLAALAFVTPHTMRLREKKSGGDDGAGVPGAERAMCGDVPAATWGRGTTARRERDPLPPKAEPTGHEVAQETAA